MTSSRWLGGILIAIAAGLAAPQLTAQLQTDVPPPVASRQSLDDKPSLIDRPKPSSSFLSFS